MYILAQQENIYIGTGPVRPAVSLHWGSESKELHIIAIISVQSTHFYIGMALASQLALHLMSKGSTEADSSVNILAQQTNSYTLTALASRIAIHRLFRQPILAKISVALLAQARQIIFIGMEHASLLAYCL